MQTKSISHGKTINLTSDNIAISSTNFSVDKNGNITAKGGTIGGFTLGATTFSTTINGIYSYNYYDAMNAMATDLGYIGKTSITSALYDVNGDGQVDVFDAQDMIEIANGTQSNNKKISGTFQINSSNPKNFIAIKNGNNLAVSIGIGGVNAHLVSADNIIVGNIKASTFGGVALNGNNGTVSAKAFNNTSLESMKKNIVKFDDALEIIKNSNIYEYNFKDEDDTDKKHIGFVIGDITKNKYKTPNEVLSSNKKGIENYSMSSIEWRALQQILERLEIVERKVS